MLSKSCYRHKLNSNKIEINQINYIQVKLYHNKISLKNTCVTGNKMVHWCIKFVVVVHGNVSYFSCLRQ